MKMDVGAILPALLLVNSYFNLAILILLYLLISAV